MKPSLHRLAAALLLVGAASVQAAVSTVTVDAAAVPGGLARPVLQFDFPTPYALIALDLQFDYDGSSLFFDEAASQVVVDGTAQSLPSFLGALAAQGSLAVNYDPAQAFGDYSFFANTSVGFNARLTFLPAFRVAPSALPGQTVTVSFSGALADENATLEDTFAVAAGVTVSAVPEPASWLMLTAGMVALGVAARRRAAA